MRKEIRLLIVGLPGTPIFEIGERISTSYKLDYFTIEDQDNDEDTYFKDKIPANHLDTGDFTSGSESSNMSRDISAKEKDIELDSLYVPNLDLELDSDELEDISSEEIGVLATEIPDLELLKWSTHVLCLKANWDAAVEWFSKRRKCPSCGNVHHLEEKPSKHPGICDRCGTQLVIKPEDTPEYVSEVYSKWKSQFSVFEMKAKGKKYWKSMMIDECKDFEEIFQKVAKWLNSNTFKKTTTSLPPIKDTKNWSHRP